MDSHISADASILLNTSDIVLLLEEGCIETENIRVELTEAERKRASKQLSVSEIKRDV